MSMCEHVYVDMDVGVDATLCMYMWTYVDVDVFVI